MFDLICQPVVPSPLLVAVSFPALTTLYWICLIIGGGLLVISTFLGGDSDAVGDVELGGDIDIGGDVSLDTDVSGAGDVDVDVSADAPGGAHVDHGHMMSLASWFSIHFIVYFMAAFGLVGVVLTALTETGNGATAGWAMLAGLLVGQGAHQLLRALRRGSGNSALRPEDFVNKPARVTVTIAHPRKGEIALRPRRGERFIPAVAKRAGTTFNIGDEVAVIGYRGGVAEVVSREEFEFLTNSNKKGGSP